METPPTPEKIDARHLAVKILMKKNMAKMMDPKFANMTEEEKKAELCPKSETVSKMEFMIENIKKYQTDFSGSRIPSFLRKKNVRSKTNMG